MKCDEPFIVAYNNLFIFLHKQGGHREVVEFWRLLGKAILGRFRYLAETKGVVGLIEYWSETLSAEGAIFSIFAGFEKDRKDDSFYMKIYECPSLKKLEDNNIKPYEHYCEHCKILYGEALRPLGFGFICKPRRKKGCEIYVRMESSCLVQADMQTPVSTL